MLVIKASLHEAIKLGRLGENKARAIKFDIHDTQEEYPLAEFSFLNRRPTDPDAYPVPDENLIIENGYLLWIVKSGDLAYEGYGECEIVATVDDIVVKKDIYTTFVDKALNGSGTPPEPWESWVEKVEDAAERAEEAAREIKEMSATAETLDPGSPATASYEDGVLTIGVPQGVEGPEGPRGLPGMESVLVGTQISGNKYQLSIERV